MLMKFFKSTPELFNRSSDFSMRGSSQKRAGCEYSADFFWRSVNVSLTSTLPVTGLGPRSVSEYRP